MRTQIALSLFALTLIGCAPLTPQKLAESSPANPNSPEGRYPRAMPVLMSGTNYTMSPQGEEQHGPSHQHGGQQKPSNGHEHHEHDHKP